jgi:purine-binding chemotaxis protein CheW
MNGDMSLILKQRARIYAKPPEEPDLVGGELIAVFRVEKMRCGFRVTSIDGIHQINRITPIPCTPPFIMGAVNIEGKVYPLIDLQVLLGGETGAPGEYKFAVIVRSEQVEVGVPVSDILSMERMPEQLLKPEPGSIGSDEEFIEGTTESGVLILDVERLLNRDDLLIMEEV